MAIKVCDHQPLCSRTKQFDMKINNRKRQNETKQKEREKIRFAFVFMRFAINFICGYDGGGGGDSHKNLNASHRYHRYERT